jgi:aryl-alcohol dehydrogenase-like predicted oxidoreductase
MERRRIGVLEVSLAGLGTNNFGRRLDAAATRVVVTAALDAGVTHFDTADTYGEGRSEEYLGRALGARRDEVTIATKFGYHGAPRGGGRQADWVPRALEASLSRLGTDRLDLLYYHRPDPRTPLAETLQVMNALLERGLVCEIGCSNFSAAQLEEAASAAAERGLRGFAVVENEYSLLELGPEGGDGTRERGVLATARRLGMAFVPYFPLASGLLSGAYRRGVPTPQGSRLGGDGRPAEQVIGGDRLDIVERLAAYAEERGQTLLELALSYLAAQPAVASVIAGATSPAQVRANAAATGAWALTSRELTEIAQVLRRRRRAA